MRPLVIALLALVCLCAPADGAPSTPRIPYLTFNEVGLTGKPRVLSRHDIFPDASSLSPDHRQLAFVPTVPDYGSHELWIADVHASGERLLLQAPGWISTVAWAPNGRTIAITVGPYNTEPDVSGIWLVEADGTGLRRVTGRGYGLLAWSPDSGSLAMTRYDQSSRSFISVFSVEAGTSRDVTEGSSPHWSPDGKSLLFSGGDGRRATAIRVVPAAGGVARTVAHGFEPTWSPNGRQIAFFRATTDTQSLWVVPSTGGRPRRIARLGARASEETSWSPGSRWIAYQRTAYYCGSRLGLARTGGGRPRRLLTASRLLTPLAWSRNGRHLLYLGERCTDQ